MIYGYRDYARPVHVGLWWRKFKKVQPKAFIQSCVDDEASTFRFKPTHEADAHLLIIAAWHPRLRRLQYYEMLGHPFGIGPAVTDIVSDQCAVYSL